ncbi:MAG: serine/threonine protein kinase [Clostridia bacterium]|nr:serine/threonine protein kinase [Clostridia bacterium]
MFSSESLKTIRIIKQNETKTISIVEDTSGIKYLKREINGDKREIYKALQKINQPNIPRIKYVELTDKTVVIEEYINGTALSEIMEQNKKLSKKDILCISKQVLSALCILHKNNILHRDVKPDNILIDNLNHVWLIDYDISRIYRNEIRKDTELKGTFGYAPIEQYGMLPTDYKTDIYAFGATLKTLLSYSRQKGSLNKIAEKCMRLDPSERYSNAESIKKAIRRAKYKKIIPGTIITSAIAGAIFFYLLNRVPSGYVRVSDEMLSIIRFEDFNASESVNKYYNYEGYDSLTIFGVDSPISHLLFIEDMEMNGKINMGRNQNTKIDASFKLKNGVLSVCLSDPYGHSFNHEFKYDNNSDNHNYELLYRENRRKNADIICWDMEKDGIEELLIGINDATFVPEEHRILSYMNYCQGWCIKYDEGRGFILCSGDMFSEGTKFWLYKEETGVYLPYFSGTCEKYRIQKYYLLDDDLCEKKYS